MKISADSRPNKTFPRIAGALFIPLLSSCVAGSERPTTYADVVVAADEEEAEFLAAGGEFRSRPACHAYLAHLVSNFQAGEFEIARGPYPVFEGDTRIHAIRTSEGEYIVLEYRCIGGDLEARSWRAGPSSTGPRPFTLEDIRGISFPEGQAD